MDTKLNKQESNIIPFEEKARLKEISTSILVEVKDAQDHIDMAREALLNVGELLLEARLINRDDQSFGKWCQCLGGAFTDKDKRASLMTLAANREEVEKRLKYLGSEARQPRSLLACLQEQQKECSMPPLISTEVYLREKSASVSQLCDTGNIALSESEEQPIETSTPTIPDNQESKEVDNIAILDSLTDEQVIKQHYPKLNFPKQFLTMVGSKANKTLLANAIREGKLGESNTCSPNGNTHELSPKILFKDYPAKYYLQNIMHREHITKMDEVIEHHTMCAGDMSKANCLAQRSIQINKQRQLLKANRPTLSISQPVVEVFSCQDTRAKFSEGYLPNDLNGETHKPLVWCGQTLWDDNNTTINYLEAWTVYKLFKQFEGFSIDPTRNSVRDVAARTGNHFAATSHYFRNVWPTNMVDFWFKCCMTQKQHADQYHIHSSAARAQD